MLIYSYKNNQYNRYNIDEITPIPILKNYKMVEVSGNNLVLNTIKAKCEIRPEGNVFQQTYNGYNLWHPNQTFPMGTYTNQYLYYDEETQVYTLNGTYSTTFFNIFTGKFDDFNEGDNVLIRIEKISGSASANLEVGGYHQETGNNAWIGHTILKPSENSAVNVEKVTKIPMTKAMIWISTANTVFDNFKFRILFAKSNDTTLKWEPFVGGEPSPSASYPQNIQVVTGNNSIIVSNGDDQSQNYPLNLGSLELPKIGDYKDFIEGTPDNWVKTKTIEKIDSYNGETITTDYISTTGGLDTGATVYYVLQTPVTVPITDTTLIGQLNSLYKKATTYENKTYINVENEENNVPLNLNIEVLEERIR